MDLGRGGPKTKDASSAISSGAQRCGASRGPPATGAEGMSPHTPQSNATLIVIAELVRAYL